MKSGAKNFGIPSDLFAGIKIITTEKYKPMKNSIVIFAAVLVITACAPQRPPKECTTYTEAADPNPAELDSWLNLDRGLHATVGSIDVLYAKSYIPVAEKGLNWEGNAWRGERVSAQLVLWSRDQVAQVECQFSEFKGKNGASLPASIARAQFVRYVITDEFAGGCGYRKPEDFASSLSPDVLDPIGCFDIEPQTTRPVWVTIDVPSDALPGTYTSDMRLYAQGKKHSTFRFTVEVLPRILPPATEWKFHLDLWQNPYAVARVYNVEPWSEGHWDALKPLMEMLAGAGQKVITATLNKRPWGGQTEDAFDSMIGWTKKTDGSWAYDYAIFDKWVEFMMGLGIKAQINCYSMVPWGNELYYTDEATGEEIKIKAKPGSKEYAEMWVPFLKDFTVHLEKKGWKDITRIAMDERAPDEMKAMLSLLEETAPGMGVALADNHKSYKLYPDQLSDLCVAHGATVEDEDRKYRKEKEYITTWYVCCADKFPNIFTFSPPAEGAFIGWYTMAAGFDGFLRWAYNSWVKEPLTDSRFRTWPAGDTYVVYPGPRSSIRFERLLEGIQDAEKIRILREEFSSSSKQDDVNKLARLNELVARFNIIKDPGNLEEMMNTAKKELTEISR
jgi:hypothetical protein